MTANPWLITLHLITLFIWVGHLLLTPRVIAYAVSRPESEREPLYTWLRRSWNLLSPAGLVVLATGLLMLFGVGWPGDRGILDYLAPRDNGAPTYWYITFHVKLVSATLLMLWDFWMGAQIFRLSRGAAPRRAWALATLMALSGALLAYVAAWLSLSALGLGMTSRYVGYGLVLLAVTGGIVAGRKLGRTDSRAKYMALHGVAAALVVLIVILIIARPLAFGGDTV
ncbi:MAG: hypothetical protein K8I27_10065 [Planctomycetes bacterium]|nr:hypothetical protein [Planctomycetota bacterium]